ncbi:MAG: MFS transporter [Chloroflexi bacterium]|jgi:MFS family permease|nr:MFS transporter [Chloroflexota bacterium]MBT3863747.1 MFS transporter [Chloroflexota bacterium]MBT4142768.1 MFS transporter [Chloroflexota bacterium]MBT4944025.1 MFS transporter [Chloroflexota bacterium]MBT5253300.1 MFS transporter [Chloroflexota bacterium]
MGFVNAHFVAYTTDFGATAVQGAGALATVGIAGLAGGLSFGYLADRFGRRPFLALSYAMRAIGYAVLLMATSLPLAILGVVIIGSSWTSVISLTGTVTSDEFGLRRLGTIYGTMFMVMPFGASSAVWLAGKIYDTNGNYDQAMWISLSMALIAATAIAMPSTGISKKIWPKTEAS